MSRRPPSWATQPVECVCGKMIGVSRKPAARRSALIRLGGVCECGRGVDVLIEREPASAATRAGR